MRSRRLRVPPPAVARRSGRSRLQDELRMTAGRPPLSICQPARRTQCSPEPTPLSATIARCPRITPSTANTLARPAVKVLPSPGCGAPLRAGNARGWPDYFPLLIDLGGPRESLAALTVDRGFMG